MNKLIFILVWLFCLSYAFAQKDSTYERAFQKGMIITNDAKEIPAEDVLIQNDSVEYYEPNSSVLQKKDLNNISEIKKYTGNYAVTGSWIGGLGGVAVGVVVALGTKSTETNNTGYLVETKTTIQTWPIYVFALAGTVIGYLVGKGISSWETVYNRSTAFINKTNLGINFIANSVYLNYRLKF